MTPRVPYVPDDIPGDVAESMRRRRSGALLELDRMLLHSPDFASGWNSMFGAIRTKTDVPESIRELCICWIAVLNRAKYEWDQHCDLAIAAGIPASTMNEVHESNLTSLDAKHRLALDYTSAITRNVDPGDDLTARIKAEFNDKVVVELVATIAGYNMVSRFLVALGVGK